MSEQPMQVERSEVHASGDGVEYLVKRNYVDSPLLRLCGWNPLAASNCSEMRKHYNDALAYLHDHRDIGS